MKKEDLLNAEFLKQFKSSKEFTSFVDTLYKRGVEQMLEGELDAHLGYQKHQASQTDNSRNGYSKKTIKTEHGQTEIQVPRDRKATFEPEIIPKRSQLSNGIESLVVSLYAKGMSVSDIHQEIKEIYQFELSTSAISRVTERIIEDTIAWQNRPLDPVYLVVWMDGIVFKVRENSKVVNKIRI